MSDVQSVPAALVNALTARRAEIVSVRQAGKRTYVRAQASGEFLFARYSTAPSDAAVFAHEAEVRRLVGNEGPLRAPPVLESGRGWILEVGVDAQPFRGHGAVEKAVAAVERLMQLELPTAPLVRRPIATLARRLRVAASPLRKSDLMNARGVIRDTGLGPVTGHGDLYAGNLLLDGDELWVVDWEGTGRWPAGYDLMRLWSTLEDPGDRDNLFEQSVELIGERHRSELRALRYAVLVYTIAGLYAAELEADRDAALARALLHGVLPSVRTEAGVD